VVYEERRLTYGELNRRLTSWRITCATSVGPEALVGLCIERSIEMVIGLLGILKAGGPMCRLTDLPGGSPGVHVARRPD